MPSSPHFPRNRNEVLPGETSVIRKKDTVYVPRIATSPSVNSTPQNTLSCLCFCQQFLLGTASFSLLFPSWASACFCFIFYIFFPGLSLCHLEVLSAASSSTEMSEMWRKVARQEIYWAIRKNNGVLLWFVLLQMHFPQNEISDIKRPFSWISACREFFQLLLPCIYKYVNDIFSSFRRIKLLNYSASRKLPSPNIKWWKMGSFRILQMLIMSVEKSFLKGKKKY